MVVLGRQEEKVPPALVLGYNNKSMLFSYSASALSAHSSEQ